MMHLIAKEQKQKKCEESDISIPLKIFRNEKGKPENVPER